MANRRKTQLGDMRREFETAQVNDSRLLKRLLDVVGAMDASPEASFAAMVSSEAEREGMYRLLRNPRVDWEDLIDAHAGQTAMRAQQAHRTLVVHDTTEMTVSSEAQLESYLKPKRKGFLAHVSLVLDATEFKRPLGIGGLEIVERKATSKLRKNGRSMRGNETTKLPDREYLRWSRGVAKTAELLSDVDDVIHVMDAESDSYELLATMQDAGHSFVTRMSHNRRAKASTDDDISRIRDLLSRARSFKRTREIQVSKRSASRAPDAAKARPTRSARTAELTLSFTTVVIQRPWYLKMGPAELRLQVVRACEMSPPRGVEPIEWMLFTNLCVSTKRDVENIIDIYRQRWPIEELFRALKTGCGFRTRNLTNRQSIYTSLALLLPIACKALALRTAARTSTRSAHSILSEDEVQVLRAKAGSMKLRLPPKPTAQQALALIAQIGGHRQSNGPPGWKPILRGVQRLEDLVTGWTLREALEM